MDNAPFFITGAPRSRTAWLANLFTTDSTICYHEPLDKLGAGPSGLIEDLQLSNPGRRIGVSDSMLVFHFAKLRGEHPSAPWLVVVRNPEDARRSFDRFVREHVKLERETVLKFFTAHTGILDRIRTMPGVLTVQYENLDRPEFVREAWEHLLPDIDFDPARAELLQGLNVQQMIEKRKGERELPWR